MIFISKYKSFRIILKPAYHIVNAMGQRNFQSGVSAEFHDGMFETQDKEIIKMMLESKFYGNKFWSDKKVEKTQAGKLLEENENEGLETTVNACPKCSYKAKNLSGLKAHIRAKHKEE